MPFIFSGFWSNLKKNRKGLHYSTSWFYPQMADYCFWSISNKFNNIHMHSLPPRKGKVLYPKVPVGNKAQLTHFLMSEKTIGGHKSVNR